MRMHLFWLSSIIAISGSPSASAMDLLQAIQHANQNDPHFAALRASRGLSAETPMIARSFLLPQINLTADQNQTTLQQDKLTIIPNLSPIGGNSSYSTRTLGARITQPLFNWSAYYQYKSAKSQRSRDDAKADEQEQNLILQVAESYFNVLRAQEALGLLQTRETALSKKLEESRARLHVGLIPKVDVIESEAQRDSIVSERLSAENQLNSAKERLSASVGTNIDNLAQLGSNRTSMLTQAPGDISTWTKLALTNNPKLIALSHNIIANEESRTALHGEYLPQINLYASYTDSTNLTDTQNYQAQLASGKNTIVGIEARWNLFSGGHSMASQKQASYQTDITRLDLQSAQQDIENKTRLLFMSVNTDISRIHASQQSVASAETAFHMIEAGQSVGTKSILDLLTSESRLYSSRLDLANSRYDYIMDSLRLNAAAGILNEDVIAQTNHWLTSEK